MVDDEANDGEKVTDAAGTVAELVAVDSFD